MGGTLQNCYTPDHLQLGKEIVLQAQTTAFDHILKEFIIQHPCIKNKIPSKWNYCQNIDTTIIIKRSEGTFVGKYEPEGTAYQNIILYNDGYIYEGEVKDGKREGLGRLRSTEGDSYEGKWKDNQPHGEGVYQGVNPRRKYVGVWQEGGLSGMGKANYEDGSFYEGNFYKSMRHGKGTIKYADSTVYEGDFSNDQIEGEGTLIGINHKYEGSWRDGKMHGVGKSYWYSDDDELLEIYQGSYECGLKHGRGEYRWSNGRVYVGEWFQGQIKQSKPQKAK